MDVNLDFEDNSIDIDDVESVESSSKLKPDMPTGRKRKRISKVWKYFEMMSKDKNGKDRYKCKWCGAIYLCPTSSGIGNMLRHMNACTKIKSRDVSQMLLEKSQQSGFMGTHQPKSQDEFRKIVVEALVMHDLPFQFVEWKGIRKIVEFLSDDFHMVSRNTVKADVLGLFEKGKQNLKKMLQNAHSKICLTFDLWNSIATDSYMCVTAHFIDSNWVLQKRVISFCFMPPTHDEVSIVDKVMSLLSEWGIDRKLFSMTLDSASLNKCFIDNLKGQLNISKALVCDGEFMHIRCLTHIINLIVQDGLKEIDLSVYKIRESVKYVRGSQVRKQKFLECVKQVDLDNKKGIRQDVPTMWNSTYLMLDSALYYRRAWCILELTDSNYKHCLSTSEWDKVEKICKFLRYFYEITSIFSGSNYPTSNLYMPKVFLAHLTLLQHLESEDEFLKKMANEMYKKLQEYWADFYTVLAIATVLDPRYKMEFVEVMFDKLYGVGSDQLTHVKSKLFSLFDEYMTSSINVSTSKVITSSTPPKVQEKTIDEFDLIFKDFDMKLGDKSNKSQKTQLEIYLEERRIERLVDLDILAFWKGYETCFPELTAMARDILCIPISVVSSESAFNNGGRVLDQYQSTLTPDVVEAIICCRDWIISRERGIISSEDITEDILNLSINDAPSIAINPSELAEGSTPNSFT